MPPESQCKFCKNQKLKHFQHTIAQTKHYDFKRRKREIERNGTNTVRNHSKANIKPFNSVSCTWVRVRELWMACMALPRGTFSCRLCDISQVSFTHCLELFSDIPCSWLFQLPWVSTSFGLCFHSSMLCPLRALSNLLTCFHNPTGHLTSPTTLAFCMSVKLTPRG